jgi:hypothetical protein
MGVGSRDTGARCSARIIFFAKQLMQQQSGWMEEAIARLKTVKESALISDGKRL